MRNSLWQGQLLLLALLGLVPWLQPLRAQTVPAPAVVAPAQLPAEPVPQPPAPASAAPLEEAPAEVAASLPWWARVPPTSPPPLLGGFLLNNDRPGCYSLRSSWLDQPGEGAPHYPYPLFGLMPQSFFDTDFHYLDRGDQQEHDYCDVLKRQLVGYDLMWSTGGELRLRYNDEKASRLTRHDNEYELLRTRIYGDIWFGDHFRAYAEFLYADSFSQTLPALPGDANRADALNLFVDIKSHAGDRGSWYLRLGRQELGYGSQRLLSTNDWANTRQTFQGSKLFLRSDRVDWDIFAVQPVGPDPNRNDAADHDQWLNGTWLTYRPQPDATIDLFYLNLDQQRQVALGRDGQRGGFDLHTVGGRYAGHDENLLWDLEGAVQLGRWADRGVLAKASTVGLGYRLTDLPLEPQLWAYYDYASGDPAPTTGSTHRTFNQLFPMTRYYLGYAGVVGRQNINDFNLQLSVQPAPWWTTLVQFHVFRLDSDSDALYDANGRVLRIDPTGSSGNDVGQELDVVVNFHLDTHQDLFLIYSHLFPGQYLRQTGRDDALDAFYLQYSYRW